MIRYRTSETGSLEPDCPPPGASLGASSGETTSHRAANPPLIFLAALSLIVAVGVLTPLDALGGSVAAWTAGLLIVTGLALNVQGSRRFTEAGTPIKPLSPSTTLVVRGVFRVSRNPMYLGMVLILVGAAVGLGSALALAVVVIFAVYIQVCFIRREEAMLARRFGAEYEAYRRRVRRWI